MGCGDFTVSPAGEQWLHLRKSQIGGQFADSVLSTHLLKLHSAILKPDFDLPVSEVDALTDL